MLEFRYRRISGVMIVCSVCFLLLCAVTSFYTVDQTHSHLHHNDAGSKGIAKQTSVEFNRNIQSECPLRSITLLKKTVYFTHVGLMSFPGSGNTWARHLIQQLTGYCTGSVYCSKILLNGGFPGECVHPNNKSNGCIVYKSHKMMAVFDKAVILIRNPYDAMKSYFNSKFGNLSMSSSVQIKTVRLSDLRNYDVNPYTKTMDIIRFNSSEWKVHVKNEIYRWQQTYISWIKIFKDRCLIVRYEDFKERFIPTLRRISNFLDVRVPEKDFICTYVNREGKHHRVQKYELGITHVFSEQQRNAVNHAIVQVMLASGNIYRLEDYMAANSEVP